MRRSNASSMFALSFAGWSLDAVSCANTQDSCHPFLWLKADSSNIELAAGSYGMCVQQWKDLSGNDIQLSQFFSGQQPVFNPDLSLYQTFGKTFGNC
eukprot:2502158-Rhodomonas_salina.2